MIIYTEFRVQNEHMSGYMPSPIPHLNTLFNSDGADKLWNLLTTHSGLFSNTINTMSKHKQTCQLQIKEHFYKKSPKSHFSTDHVCKLSQKINQSGINYWASLNNNNYWLIMWWQCCQVVGVTDLKSGDLQVKSNYPLGLFQLAPSSTP